MSSLSETLTNSGHGVGGRSIEYPPCSDPDCQTAVRAYDWPDGQRTWFITMGHAGFNSPVNNRRGYSTSGGAYRAIRRYLG